MRKSLISIIIPTFNRAHYIAETLDSLLEQSYEDWECIIIDDGSTDETERVLSTYLDDSRFSYHKRIDKYKHGGNGARNMGFDLCSGEYVKWFDSDDIMHPNLLMMQFQEIEKNNYDFVSCDLSVFEDSIRNVKNEASKQFNNKPLNKLQPALDMLSGSFNLQTNCPLWRKSFLSDHSLFDDRLYFAHENDFNFRLLLDSQSQSFGFINKSLVYLRREKNENVLKKNKLTSDPKIITSIFLYYENVFLKTSTITSDNVHYNVKSKMMNYAVYRMIFQYTKLRLLDKKQSSIYLKKIRKYVQQAPLSFIIKLRWQLGLTIFHLTQKGHQIIHIQSISLK